MYKLTLERDLVENKNEELIAHIWQLMSQSPVENSYKDLSELCEGEAASERVGSQKTSNEAGNEA